MPNWKSYKPPTPHPLIWFLSKFKAVGNNTPQSRACRKVTPWVPQLFFLLTSRKEKNLITENWHQAAPMIDPSRYVTTNPKTSKPPAPQTPVKAATSDVWPCSRAAPGLFEVWFVCLRGGGTVLLSPPNICPSFIHLHSQDGPRCHHPRAGSPPSLKHARAQACTLPAVPEVF